MRHASARRKACTGPGGHASGSTAGEAVQLFPSGLPVVDTDNPGYKRELRAERALLEQHNIEIGTSFGPLRGKIVVVTAGPTREALDPAEVPLASVLTCRSSRRRPGTLRRENRREGRRAGAPVRGILWPTSFSLPATASESARVARGHKAKLAPRVRCVGDRRFLQEPARLLEALDLRAGVGRDRG